MPDSLPRDEMVDGHGGVRPMWRPLLAAFHGLGEGGLQDRARRLDRAFEEDGVSAMLPAATMPMDRTEPRAWRCDPIPVLLGAAEFAALEAGLAERARLLADVLDDLYGPQTLLHDGLLPAPAVFASPGFLRPCRNGPGETSVARLTLYAADLIRGPDGGWSVLADRTASITGMGAARENRRLLSRVLPEAFRTLPVRHQGGFFDRWRDALGRGHAETPHLALLSPGLGDPHWFDDVVLSRELSCTLVEGGDLTVRGGRLFLKTLQRLQPVDVLLRRIDGPRLDPLELDADGDGVPGLLDAVRHGGVSVFNGPGSELAAAPVVTACLDLIARSRLGRSLALPGVPASWLGAPGALAAVAGRFDRVLLRRASDPGAPACEPQTMPEAARTALLARVRQRPQDWVAVDAGPLGTVPGVADGATAGMEAVPLALRLFLVADGGQWHALPGGLGRVVSRADAFVPDLPRGALTKDVWVLADEAGERGGAPVTAQPPLRLQRAAGDLPSRVADNLFWLGRYVERLDRAARLARSACGRLIQAGSLSPRQQVGLRVLATCLTEAGVLPADAAGVPAMTEALLASLRPRGRVHLLCGEIARLTEAVRDRLTDEMYGTFVQTLGESRHEILAVGRDLARLAAATVAIRRFCTAVSGVAAENMVRGGGFLFLDLGRRLERAHAVTVEVAAGLAMPTAQIEGGLALVLELCDSAITYRTRYLNVLQAAPVLDLVLADQGNPRGFAFQMVAMHNHLDELNVGGFGREAMAGAAAGLLAQAEALVSGVLGAAEQAQAAARLPPALRELAGGVAALSDRIVRRYFALLPAAQSVGWGGQAWQGAA